MMLAGCANLNSIHHTFNTPQYSTPPTGRAIAVDVKQRFLEMTLDTTSTDSQSRQRQVDGNTSDAWVMCAEPSPDALSAYSGSFAGNLSLQLPTDAAAKDIAAATAAAFAEQAAAFGLRTQSITLLRDAAFRLCEGYMNKALERRQFETLHRRLQNIMVATLAIEQVTGYARPTVTAIGSSARASAAGRAMEALKDLERAKKDQGSKEDAAKTAHADADKAKTDADTAKTDLDTATQAQTAATAQADKDEKARVAAQDALDKLTATATADQRKAAEALVAKTKADAEKSAAAKTKADQDAADKTKAKSGADDKVTASAKAADDADAAAKAAKDNTKLAQEALDAAQGLAAEAIGTTAQFSSPELPSPVSPEVAATVSQIVKLAIDRDYTKDTCLDYLVGGGSDDVVKGVCVELMKTIIDGLKAEIARGTVAEQAPTKAYRPSSRLPPIPDSGLFGPFNR